MGILVSDGTAAGSHYGERRRSSLLDGLLDPAFEQACSFVAQDSGVGDRINRAMSLMLEAGPPENVANLPGCLGGKTSTS